MAESRSPVRSAEPSVDGDRYGRLHDELRRPAFAMVRRAFGATFCEAEIEDIYSSAWLGTLRALRSRGDHLADDELRRYLLTAVANHASKELRRRGRRPTAPLEDARAVVDSSAVTPDEQATDREATRIARDVLTTLPPRRRAVLMLRYGWGLEPREVCAVIDGLSARAYRREITRGVRELGEKLKEVEAGNWCGSREPVLRAYVAGIASDEEVRQATSHLDHCRQCSEYVGKLSGLLHDASGALVWTSAATAIGGASGGVDGLAADAAQRVGAAVARARDRLVGAGTDQGVELSAAQVATSGGARGAGAASAGVLGKLAGFGLVGKATLACVGAGAAATACVVAGIVPGIPVAGDGSQRGAEVRAAESSEPPPRTILPTPVAEEPPRAPEDSSDDSQASPPAADDSGKGVERESQNAPVGSPAPAAPPEDHEFGLAGVAASGGGGGSAGGAGSEASSGGAAESAAQEFGP